MEKFKIKEDPTKVLFLDIDGVLNSEPFFKNREKENPIKREWDLKKLDLLKEIHDKTHCKIVMSSSWRHFYFDKKHSRVNRLKADLKERGIVIRNKTGFEYKSQGSPEGKELWGRGWQIDLWLKDHPQAKNFAILDDDSFDLQTFPDNLVHTLWHGEDEEKCGLTPECVSRCVELLNKESNP